MRQEALDAIKNAALSLIDCSEEKQNVSEAAVQALHQTEAGLRSLSIVMRQAAQFWKHMEVSNELNMQWIVHLEGSYFQRWEEYCTF